MISTGNIKLINFLIKQLFLIIINNNGKINLKIVFSNIKEFDVVLHKKIYHLYRLIFKPIYLSVHGNVLE